MLVESAVEQDEDLMMAYMEGEEPSLEDIKRCIRKGTRDLAFFNILWFCIQKQRYAVGTRRGCRLPTFAYRS